MIVSGASNHVGKNSVVTMSREEARGRWLRRVQVTTFGERSVAGCHCISLVNILPATLDMASEADIGVRHHMMVSSEYRRSLGAAGHVPGGCCED
jgi:hypothetical protein